MFAKLNNGKFTGGGFSQHDSRVDEAILSSNELVYAEVESIEDDDGEIREPTIAELKDAKMLQINTITDHVIDQGFEYDGHTFDSDMRAKVNLIGMATALRSGIDMPKGFTWRSKDNQDVPVTADDVEAMGRALMDHVFAVYQASWAMKKLVSKARSLTGLNKIDVLGGLTGPK